MPVTVPRPERQDQPATPPDRHQNPTATTQPELRYVALPPGGCSPILPRGYDSCASGGSCGRALVSRRPSGRLTPLLVSRERWRSSRPSTLTVRSVREEAATRHVLTKSSCKAMAYDIPIVQRSI